MGDYVQQQQQPHLTTALEDAGQFMFLVFMPNLYNHRVKVWVDGGEVVFSMVIDKFIKQLEKIIGYNLANEARVCCMSNGNFFLLDRTKGEIIQVRRETEKDYMSNSEMKKMMNGILEAKPTLNPYDLNENMRRTNFSEIANDHRKKLGVRKKVLDNFM